MRAWGRGGVDELPKGDCSYRVANKIRRRSEREMEDFRRAPTHRSTCSLGKKGWVPAVLVVAAASCQPGAGAW